MLAKLLIDAIVHQTTVLIAGVSTAAGIRAPLAHVADQVFVDLSRAIEEQGVGRKVAADMFGLALRTYQKKVQRLSESSSAAHRTLWEAVLDHLEKNPDTTRQRLMKRFAVDGEDNVAAVLNDLLVSGVLERRGKGPQAVYRLSPRDVSGAALRELDRDEIATLLWVFIYRRRIATLGEIASVTGWKEEVITAALADLCASGRIEAESAGDGGSSEATTRYRASTVTVPVGAVVGWAGAVIDHYQTVCTAIVTKLQAGSSISLPQDTVGGATLGFDIYPGHPHEEEVYALLRTVRGDVNRLWEKVAAHNRENPIPESRKRKVHFYFGQTVQDAVLETTPEGAANPADEAETEVEG
jgi:hypothetical protein